MSNLQYQIGGGGGGAGPAGPPGPPGSVNTTIDIFPSESLGIGNTNPGDFFVVQSEIGNPYQDAQVDRMYFHGAGGEIFLIKRSPQRVVDVDIASGAGEPPSFIDVSATLPDYSGVVDINAPGGSGNQEDQIYQLHEITARVDLTVTNSPAAAVSHFYELTYEDSTASFITFARGSINIPAGAAVGEVFTYYLKGVYPALYSGAFISGNDGGSNTFGNVSFTHAVRITRLIDAPSFANEPS